MRQFLIGWTADTLEGHQWGEFEHVDEFRVTAQEWAWRHLDIVTGLNLRRVLSLSISVRPMSDADDSSDAEAERRQERERRPHSRLD